ncbi:ATP-binding protein [Streptomyces sp. NPDC058665]|uniref:ATP-binding protein n=1 Tax=Streptomyces sp. NPDC058665 TaxID=3346586 RepID=UPI0036495427
MSGRTHIKRFRIRRDSVPAARRHVEVLLTEWKLGGLVDVAALVTSELTTNVVQHALGTGEFFELGLRRRGGVLVLEVSDSFRWQMPELRKPQETDAHGRGLLLVDALSAGWGVRPRDVGKTVWVHLPIHRQDLV